MSNNRSKRIFAALLALTLVLAVCPAPAKAAATCPCCGEDLSDITWKSLPNVKTLPAGHYKLTGDTTLTQQYTTDGTTTVDLNGCTLTPAENKRPFYVNTGSLNILDSVGTATIVSNGTGTASGGLLKVAKGATLNLYGGTVTGGRVGEGCGGGNVRVEGTFNMYGGKITGGQAPWHGGNFSVSGGTVNIHGGIVEAGQSTGDGRGGNFYLTGASSALNIYGGTIRGGISAGTGGNVYVNSGASATMYGGTVENGVADSEKGFNFYVSSMKDGKYSSFIMYGGTLISQQETALARYNENNPTVVYNGAFVGQDPTQFKAECACVCQDETGYRVWNCGHQAKTCDATCPFEVAAQTVTNILSGVHTYRPAAVKNTAVCGICHSTVCHPGAVAITEHALHSTLPDAITAGGDIWLLDDVQAEDVVIDGVTLDLNGYCLTASGLSATTGNVIDSTGGLGSLVSESVALSGSNQYLPLDEDGDLRFASMTPDVTLERLTRDSVRVRFVFAEKAAETVIDDLVLAGNEELSVQLYLTWKDAAGTPKEKTYVCDPALLTKYAQKWDGRRYTATITGVDAVTDLTCTVQVASRACSGVTVSATTLQNVAFINKKLSWDAINSYPVKTADMTVSEMRDLCVAFFEYGKTFLWTPDESMDYIRNSNGAFDSVYQGTVYGGLPYVGNASGSVYRMMDYVNPETGLVDMKKAIPALGTKDRLAQEDLMFFGSQCAKTASVGWGRVINSADYRRTGNLLPYHGVILLGDVAMDESKTSWSEDYRTTQVCKENGKQTMFEAYGQLKKADGLVYYTTAGHVVMAYSDAYVVRNEDGTVNGDESYVRIIHQAQTWSDQENEVGDKYRMEASVDSKMTFSKLYSGSYIPFTFAEFVEEDPIEETTLTITAADETVLLSGAVREADRSFVTETAPESLTFTQLCDATVTSNYGISDVYIILYNERGQQLYQHAVRSTSSGIPSLKMVAQGDRVTTWQYGKMVSGKAYHAEVVVQLFTGERPTIWSGILTI